MTLFVVFVVCVIENASKCQMLNVMTKSYDHIYPTTSTTATTILKIYSYNNIYATPALSHVIM